MRACEVATRREARRIGDVPPSIGNSPGESFRVLKVKETEECGELRPRRIVLLTLERP
jgi:hypothetical protein